MYLSEGNRKMPRGFLIWNLPSGKTCPKSTAECRRICYAKKAERQYKSVVKARERNLAFVLNEEDWVDKLSEEIEKKSKKRPFKGFFRIHESGDFFSQIYLDGWKRIAGKFPEIKFLAFTKSFHLDFRGMPENMQVVWSVMPDTKEKTPEGAKAYSGDCEYDREDTIECAGTCEACYVCWGLSKKGFNVHFEYH